MISSASGLAALLDRVESIEVGYKVLKREGYSGTLSYPGLLNATLLPTNQGSQVRFMHAPAPDRTLS